jgi:hypothetical protein
MQVTRSGNGKSFATGGGLIPISNELDSQVSMMGKGNMPSAEQIALENTNPSPILPSIQVFAV